MFLLCSLEADAGKAHCDAVRVRRQRAAYHYVQEVLGPPAEQIEDQGALQSRVYNAGRMVAFGGLSVLGGEALMFVIHKTPWVSNIMGVLDRRIKICHDTIAIASSLSRHRTELRDLLLGRNEMDQVQRLDGMVVIPNFQDHLLNYLAKKTAIENIFAWVKKGATSLIFFGLCRYFSKDDAATWTYKSILQKVIEEWPVHQYFFPKELRPRFILLYDAYIARHKTLVMDEEDAQQFIEWTCLEVIDTLMLL